MAKKATEAKAGVKPLRISGNGLKIAEARRAEHVRYLMSKIEDGRRALENPGLPIGNAYDPGGAIAKQRNALRDSLLSEIGRLVSDIADAEVLTGDPLVCRFAPECVMPDEPQEVIPLEETLARGAYIGPRYVHVDRDPAFAGLSGGS